MAETQKQSAIKVTLKSGKVVILREMKIADHHLAAKQVKTKDNQIAATLELQDALLKLLILEVGGHKKDHSQKNDLDKLFTVAEYSQLLKVVQKLTGEDASGEEPVVEMLAE